MSALNGSISVRRYRVLGNLPADFRETFERGVKAHVLIPIDPETSQEDRAVGWCSLHDSEDLDLGFEKFFFDDRVLLSMRIDVLKPSAQDVKRLVQKRKEHEEGKRKSPLSKSGLRSLKEQVIAELRRKTTPKTKTIDMVWHLPSSRLYFHSQSKGPSEVFVDLFTDTFGVGIDIEGPGVWAMDYARDEGEEEIIKGLRPTAALLGGFTGLRPDIREMDVLDMMAAS